MVKGTGRHKLLLAATIVLAVVYLADRMVLSGLLTRMRQLRTAITTEEAALRMNLGLQARKAALLDESKTYSAYLITASPEHEITARFLKEVERIAQESGVSLTDLTPDAQPSKTTDVRTYRAQLRADATLWQLWKLFDQLQRSHLLLTLDRFTLTPKDEQASLLRLEATLNLAVP